ncbi:hypothetical protein BC941DRAFT_448806 [Chlamydoabsidia padenii]|nr:hypothetical protein BC941DRAFT_448806 [Chlamydoabsidia padenii]
MNMLTRPDQDNNQAWFNQNPDHDNDDSDSVNSHRSWTPEIKPRRRFSTKETKYLEKEFEKFSNPSSETLQDIAQTIGTTRRIITTWFQNRRAKKKRETKVIQTKTKRARRKKKTSGMNAELENTTSGTPAEDPPLYDTTCYVEPSSDWYVWSSYPIISWSQSLPHSLYHSDGFCPLPQCCLDEMCTGIPCAFHSF